MKHCRSVVLLWGLVFGNALLQAHAVLRISFVEDLCYNTKLSVIDLKYDSTGILMSAPSINMKGSFECEVNLVPPKGSSVVLSIFKYDLYGGDELIIEDSDRHRIALMGYGLFKDEKKSIVSDGRMFIRYKTDNSTIEHRRAGFQFTFTKVMNSPCSSNEFKCNNGKCVLKELICDGHNHCGDRSDQMRCDSIRKEPKEDANIPENRSLRQPAVMWVSLIGIACIIVLIVIIVSVVVLVRRAKQKKANNGNAPSTNTNRTDVPLQSTVPRQGLQSVTVPTQVSNGSNVPRQAFQSANVPTHPVSNGSNVPRQAFQSANVPTHQVSDGSNVPEGSFYNRVRRSIRGVRSGPKIENVTRERSAVEQHPISNMYPSLDQVPTAPNMHGVENTGYRVEE